MWVSLPKVLADRIRSTTLVSNNNIQSLLEKVAVNLCLRTTKISMEELQLWSNFRMNTCKGHLLMLQSIIRVSPSYWIIDFQVYQELMSIKWSGTHHKKRLGTEAHPLHWVDAPRAPARGSSFQTTFAYIKKPTKRRVLIMICTKLFKSVMLRRVRLKNLLIKWKRKTEDPWRR